MFTSSATAEKYPGPPLPTEDHIRLLLLQPGTSVEPIYCQLVVTTLASAPAYESLSYVWGNVSDPVTISLQALEADNQYGHAVTQNCFAALQRLRHQDRQRTMWVDALCIDQSNPREQSHQITLMSDIYSQASGVVVYLGESSVDSDLAVDCILHYDDPDPYSVLEYTRSDALVEALHNLFHRPWFRRVWVIQEVAFARKATVICGTRLFDWSALQNFKHASAISRWLKKVPYVVGVSKPEVPDWVLQNPDESGTFILDELDQARHCEATNPRDKIYALLPFIYASELGINIPPNYSDSCAKVFTQYAAALVTTAKFRVLQAVQGESKMKDIPSWVPDWTIPPQSCFLGYSDRMSQMRLSLSQEQACRLRVLPEDKSEVSQSIAKEPTLPLQAFGYLDGNVTKMGSVYLAGHGAFPLAEWQDLVRHNHFDPALSSEAQEYAFESAICRFSEGTRWVEQFLQIETEHPDQSWEKIVHDLAQRFKNSAGLSYKDIPFWDAGKVMPPSARTVLKNILERCHSRRIFVTDTGRVGLGPAALQLGDAVYTCVGAEVQFAFRSCGIDGMERTRVELVGECFASILETEKPPYRFCARDDNQSPHKEDSTWDMAEHAEAAGGAEETGETEPFVNRFEREDPCREMDEEMHRTDVLRERFQRKLWASKTMECLYIV